MNALIHLARRARNATLPIAVAIVAVATTAGAQQSIRQVVDSGVRNTLPGRPMGTPRKATGGMSGMAGMSGSGTTGGMKPMPGMGGDSAMPGMAMSADSTVQGLVDLQARLMALLELNTRLLNDPAIRERVLADPTLRALVERASSGMNSGMDMSGAGHMGTSHDAATGKMPAGMDMSRPASMAPGDRASSAHEHAAPAQRSANASAASKSSSTKKRTSAALVKKPVTKSRSKKAPRPAAKKPMALMPNMPGMKMP